MALLTAAGDAAGHCLNALHIGHRGAAKLLNQQGHGGVRRWASMKEGLIIRLGPLGVEQEAIAEGVAGITAPLEGSLH